MNRPEQNENARSLILGALVDFLEHLNTLEAPIVVGNDYPNDKLIDVFKEWTEQRNVSLKTINKPAWLKLCEQGFLKDEDA